MHENWKHISKAPRDGTIITALDHAGNRATIAYRGDEWRITFPVNGLMSSTLMDGQPFNAVWFDDVVVLLDTHVYTSNGQPTQIIQWSRPSDPDSWSSD
jgi:hypothetical protein